MTTDRQPVSYSSTSVAAGILSDASSERVFDRITELVTEVFAVPISLISVVDGNRQYFKSFTGLPEPVASRRETPLSHSFCRTVVAQGEPLVIPDARQDEQLKMNPAIEELGVIAYAGAPIFDDEGNAFAALCAIDSKPREWSRAEISVLRTMAEQVTNEVGMRLKLSRMGVDLENLRAVEEVRRQIGRADRHDLRTPLGSLLLNLQAVRQFGAVNDDQAECLQAAEQSGHELLSMVDQLLDIGNVDSRGRQALTVREIHVAGLLARAGEQVAPLARDKRLTLLVTAPEPELTVAGDEDKIRRVLVNLLANAVKFTDPGGRVAVSAESTETEVRMAVRDTGIGIAAEHLERLFAEGFRVDSGAPTRRSAGLGLTFCQRIVEAHGGHLRVESEPGQGSTFTVILPRRSLEV